MYLLTSIKGIPVIIKCKTVHETTQYKAKGATVLSDGVWERNKHLWTQQSDIDYICDLVNDFVEDNECWIRIEDAYK
jgi:hypothetical protein